jgi:hypothetical protein
MIDPYFGGVDACNALYYTDREGSTDHDLDEIDEPLASPLF